MNIEQYDVLSQANFALISVLTGLLIEQGTIKRKDLKKEVKRLVTSNENFLPGQKVTHHEIIELANILIDKIPKK